MYVPKQLSAPSVELIHMCEIFDKMEKEMDSLDLMWITMNICLEHRSNRTSGVDLGLAALALKDAHYDCAGCFRTLGYRLENLSFYCLLSCKQGIRFPPSLYCLSYV